MGQLHRTDTQGRGTRPEGRPARSGSRERQPRRGSDPRRRRRLPAGFVPFHTPVRGYRFAARPPRAEHPRAGQRVGLIREVQHPVDPWAVSLWLRSAEGTPWRIGYLDRAVAARIGPRLDAGEAVRAAIAGWEGEHPDRRPVIVVEPDPNPDLSAGPPPR